MTIQARSNEFFTGYWSDSTAVANAAKYLKSLDKSTGFVILSGLFIVFVNWVTKKAGLEPISRDACHIINTQRA